MEEGTKKTWFVRQDSKLWSQMDNKLVQEALGRSGENRKNLESALTQVAPEQLEAMEFFNRQHARSRSEDTDD